jgi:hypothetical protein
MENQIENMSMMLRQARIHMLEDSNFVPVEFVNTVRLSGDVETYTALEGYDLTTFEGQERLLFNSALYILCVDRCLMGAGHLPFQLHPFMDNPVIEEEQREDADGMDQPIGHPEHHAHEPVAVVDQGGAQPVAAAPPVPIPAPVPYLHQPLYWVFREPPEPEVKPEPNQGPGEYVEPNDEDYPGLA